jgi:hypothetical protein
MKVLPILLLCLSCGPIEVTDLKTDMRQTKAELLELRHNVDSCLVIINLMEANLKQLSRLTDSVKIDASYKDTISRIDTIIWHQFIGTGNVFIQGAPIEDTMKIMMNDSVLFKIWNDGSRIITP